MVVSPLGFLLYESRFLLSMSNEKPGNRPSGFLVFIVPPKQLHRPNENEGSTGGKVALSTYKRLQGVSRILTSFPSHDAKPSLRQK
jgi:hypothetical protein